MARSAGALLALLIVTIMALAAAEDPQAVPTTAATPAQTNADQEHENPATIAGRPYSEYQARDYDYSPKDVVDRSWPWLDKDSPPFQCACDGQNCTAAEQVKCCSKTCSETGQCCKPNGASTSGPIGCCGGGASGGTCCTAGGGSCTDDTECCGGSCLSRRPTFMSYCCLAPGQICQGNSDCCDNAATTECGAIDQASQPNTAPTCCTKDAQICPDPAGKGCCGYACSTTGAYAGTCCRFLGVRCDPAGLLGDAACCDITLNQCIQGPQLRYPQCCRRSGQPAPYPLTVYPWVDKGLGCCSSNTNAADTQCCDPNGQSCSGPAGASTTCCSGYCNGSSCRAP